MNRIELKEWAKQKIRGNELELWKGIIIVIFISFLCTIPSLFFGDESVIGDVLEVIADIITIPLSIGLIHYFIIFIRKNTFEKEVIYDHYNEFARIVITLVVMGILIMAGFIFLIIPGIILSLSLVLVPYLLVEKRDLSCFEIIELSIKMMKGHKLDYFVLSLTFLGWCLLIIPTCGLILIWLYPYMTVTLAKFALDIIDNY